MTTYESWGRFPRVKQTPRAVRWRHEPLPLDETSTVLPHGQGRSYGDSCLNDGGVILTTENLGRFISFDRDAGVLRAEAGATLAEILKLVVPAGWFLPVTPGTKYVSLGGAIANDIHGKNHHVAGCFGNHVRRFELLRSSGERLVCSPDENVEHFRAAIGGMGLTGLVTWAEIQLLKIEGPWIATENVKLRGIDEFFDVTAQSDRFAYTVAWIDSLATGKSVGRGLFFRGNHAPADARRGARPDAALPGGPLASVPFDMPGFVLNRLSIKAFNTLYYAKQLTTTSRAVTHYEPFFYPLDAVGDWNRIYGKRGFLQYQAVVDTKDAVVELLNRIAREGSGSFLTVLKVFGDVRSPGMMSFPRPGITLNLDFPIEGKKTLALCERLDDVVRQAKGRLYPAKDARMPAEMFRAAYPQWEEFAKYVDPKFSSSFWRRVTS